MVLDTVHPGNRRSNTPVDRSGPFPGPLTTRPPVTQPPPPSSPVVDKWLVIPSPSYKIIDISWDFSHVIVLGVVRAPYPVAVPALWGGTLHSSRESVRLPYSTHEQTSSCVSTQSSTTKGRNLSFHARSYHVPRGVRWGPNPLRLDGDRNGSVRVEGGDVGTGVDPHRGCRHTLSLRESEGTLRLRLRTTRTFQSSLGSLLFSYFVLNSLK